MKKFLIVFVFLSASAFAKDIFKTDTIRLGGKKITRIIRSDKKNVALTFNGGGFKSFTVPLSDVAKVDVTKLPQISGYYRQAVISLFYVSPRKEIVPYVRDFVSDKNVWVRWDVVNILLKTKDNSAASLDAVQALFSDPSPDLKIKLCEYYNVAASSGYAKSLYYLLWDDDADVRLAALTALSELVKGKSFLRVCEGLLADKSGKIRRKSLEILAAAGRISEDKLCRLLTGDKSPEVRRLAAGILYDKGTSKSIKFLIKALSDRDKEVRQKARRALNKIRSRSEIPL
ncbi:MAG: HEAT repeat domain-containing protein [Elusimicrobia bacterium]|nr:HEAT repeat domain-containing protein [Elusimicrobiota bacterium]